MPPLSTEDEAALIRLATTMVNQEAAHIIVEPQQRDSGFWFGGGNMVQAPDGSLLVVGRYRNAGDSRVGTTSGVRGLELAIFQARDASGPFEKVLRFEKPDLNVGDREVLSIEGSALRVDPTGEVELFVSTEKSGIDYPPGLESYLKPHTGVWTIERLAASTLPDLKDATVETVLEAHDPQFIHVKDPFLYECPDGQRLLLFCSHPFSWTSSNSGYALLRDGQVVPESTKYDFFPRGFTWDVAMTRATCVVDVPRLGRFEDQNVSLIFYDGGECVRDLQEHAAAVTRPRGYSCEELGGLAYVVDNNFDQVCRLSKQNPLFVSPWGTGCSRYVDVLPTEAGLCVTWQQSQQDHSQPLVMNVVPRGEVERILA